MNKPFVHSDQDTSALVQACKAGDSSVFEYLYTRYSKAMFNICLRMLVSREDAEDVLQESFIAAFSKINQYSANVEFGAWLKSIVIRKCIDTLRKKKLLMLPFDPNEVALLDEEQTSAQDEPEYTVDDVYAALQELTPGYRVVLSLYLFESLSHRQIADQLGISEGTSKSQYARGKKKLMELIANKKESHAG